MAFSWGDPGRRIRTPPATGPEAGSVASGAWPPPSGSLRGNAQLLSRVDLVGVRQHGPVGLEDLVVQVGVAVVLLGDLRERVTLDHGVVAGLGGRGGHRQLVIDMQIY